MKKNTLSVFLIALLSCLFLLAGCSRLDGTTAARPSGKETKTPAESTAPSLTEPAGSTTEEPTVPVLPEIGETPELEFKDSEAENLDDLDTYITALEKGLVDEDGCALNDQALDMLVDRFCEDAQKAVDKGVYQAVLKDENKAFVLLNSGVVYLYEPYRKGFLSGGGSEGGLQILVVNSFANEVDFQKRDKNIFPKGYREIIESLKESDKEISSEIYENMGCTTDAYLKMLEPGKKIICLGGHGIQVKLGGGINNYMDTSFATFIVSGIKYEEDQEETYKKLGLYPDGRDTGFVAFFARVWQNLLVKGDVVVNQKRFLCLTPNFFRNLSTHHYLDNSVVILDSCSGAMNGLANDTIQALLERGADVIVGYSDDVELLYDYALNGALLEGILDKNNEDKSFEEILTAAKEKAEEVDYLLHKETHLIMDEANNYVDGNGVAHHCEALIFGDWADKTVSDWLNKEISFKDAYRFYYDYLSAHKAVIGYMFSNPSDPLNRAVAFADVWGDETPEMLFCMERDAPWQPGTKFYSDLFVMTWQNGAAWWVTDGGLVAVTGTSEALAEGLTYMVADGGRFAVFMNQKQKGIKLIKRTGDAYSRYTFVSYLADDLKGLVEDDNFYIHIENISGVETKSYGAGKSSLSEADFYNKYYPFAAKNALGDILLTNVNNPSGVPEMSLPAYTAGEKLGEGMNCEEALAYLWKMIQKYADPSDENSSREFYADVLDYLAEQVRGNWKNEDRKRSYEYQFDEPYYKTGGELGYTFVDLNEDGIDELVILQRTDRGVGELVLYTIKDGKRVCLERQSAHYYFRMNADKTVRIGDIYSGEVTCRLNEKCEWITVEGQNAPEPMTFEFIPFAK